MTPTLRPVRRPFATMIVCGSLLLVGCTSSADLVNDEPDATASSPTASPTGVPEELATFYEQDVDWSGCGAFECATVEMPVDYDAPEGSTIELAIKKRPADDQGARIGTLFINPGGPGGSGQDYVDSFTSQTDADLLARYDVVGFDPRGVGESTPLTCLSDKELDAYTEGDPDPDTAAEAQGFYEAIEGLGNACAANSGDLAAHVSTQEVAQDLDVLRGIVGDATINYDGASYGTAIGATYAELFPERVGRMVLDGAIDPALSNEEISLGQSEGFHRALEAYVADCVEGGSCPLGTDAEAGVEQVGELLDGLDAQPLQTNDPERPLTESLGFYGIALPLYNEQGWPVLSQALEAAMDGDGSVLLAIADQYLSRDSNGNYADNSTQVIYAVNCLDAREATPEPITGEQATKVAKQTEDAYTDVSPVFGRVFAWDAQSCGVWPIEPTEEPLEIDAEGAPPIVVIGTTRDPATPYEWAQGLASELDSGVLISRDGDGHTGYNMGNSCVDDAVNSYLLDDEVPEDGLEC